MMVTFDVVAFVLRPSSCEWCAVILNSPIKPFTSQIQFVGHIQLQERKGKLITWEDGYSSVTTQAFQQLATEVSSKVVFWITLHFLLPAFQLIFFADSLTSIFFMTDLPLNVGVAMFSGSYHPLLFQLWSFAKLRPRHVSYTSAPRHRGPSHSV